MRANAMAGPWPAGDRVLALVGPDAVRRRWCGTPSGWPMRCTRRWMALHFERLDSAERSLARRWTLRASSAPRWKSVSPGDVVAAHPDCAARPQRHPPGHRARQAGFVAAPVRPHAGRHADAARAAAFTLHVVPPPSAPLAGAARGQRPAGRLAAMGALPRRWWRPWSALGEAAARRGWNTRRWACCSWRPWWRPRRFWGLAIGLFAAVLGFLAWNFFFIPPFYQLTIEEPRDVIAVFVFAGVAAVTGLLASRVRRGGRRRPGAASKVCAASPHSAAGSGSPRPSRTC